jgi:hypothetical protein
LMRVMAGDAFAIFNRLMFDFGGSDLLLGIFVAIETEFAVRLDQEFFVVRNVRVMAGGAFAVLNGLMFDFGGD